MTLSTSMKQTLWEGGEEVISIISSGTDEKITLQQHGSSTSSNVILLTRAQFLALCELFDKA